MTIFSYFHSQWRQWRSSPLFWILVFAALVRTAGIAWGLPASDGWDNDGVAPRNFLVGLAETYTPGHYYTYPPLHMILLAVLSLPGIILALIGAPSLSPRDVIGEMIQVPYMTYFAVVARIVSVGFALGTIAVVGKMAELVAGRRAGWLAAAALALNAAHVYYSQVSNLDCPSLFWSCLSLWLVMRVIAERNLRLIRWAALAAVAAVTTKDQTYAVFLLALPAALAGWFWLEDWPRRNAGPLLQSLALWGGVAILAILSIDGALINPQGFARRLAFLTGSASQDYTQYQAGIAGWLAVLADMAAFFQRFYPLTAVLLVVAGLVGIVWRPKVSQAAAALPLLAALSFTVAFNFVALRTETRFILPQSVFLAVYIGIGAEMVLWLVGAQRKAWAWAILGSVAVWSAYGVAGMDASFLLDPRYDAERWLQKHIRPGDRIEIYGLNAYLPRMPEGAVVSRIDAKPVKSRNPLPQVKEVAQLFGEIHTRNPRFLVVPGIWVKRYLALSDRTLVSGRSAQKVREIAFQDMDARLYFGALFAGRLPYRMAHRSDYQGPSEPPVHVNGSLRQTVFIFERDPSRDFAPIVTAPKSAAIMQLNPPIPAGVRRGRYQGWDGTGVTLWQGLAFVSLGYHIDRTWGWDA